MTRIPFICGNWKLNHSLAATKETLTLIRRGMANLDGVEAGIAPVTTCLASACEVTSGQNALGIAAQNVFWAEKGAFTGEWSVAHLKELGCKYAIIGHSERRQYFAETDEGVGKKVRATLDGGLVPIACVGESLEEREGGKTMDVIHRQTAAILALLEKSEVGTLVLAYEPVWAIGTGKTATAAQAQEVHAGIRAQIREAFGDEADKVRIQYGGSVKPANAAELLSEEDVDGALVGGASLDAESFLGILKAAAEG
ncbi:MAG: triose-phosphate isomerase [Deltaproteobacteria bacterium]|nr:triose-phosphate isomerase [Deltaproteobacteria bacterium]